MGRGDRSLPPTGTATPRDLAAPDRGLGSRARNGLSRRSIGGEVRPEAELNGPGTILCTTVPARGPSGCFTFRSKDVRTTAQWKRWFERREGKKKKKSGKKAAVRQKVQAQESAIPMSGLSLPGVVSESTFLAGSPGRSRILEIADRLRKNPTPAEDELRRILNRLNGGVLRGRFKREHAISGRWIVDFYFPEIRLAIEVDGSVHLTEDQSKRDRLKDADCARFDITVFRVANCEVYGDRRALIEKLRAGWGKALDRENRIIGMDAEGIVRLTSGWNPTYGTHTIAYPGSSAGGSPQAMLLHRRGVLTYRGSRDTRHRGRIAEFAGRVTRSFRCDGIATLRAPNRRTRQSVVWVSYVGFHPLGRTCRTNNRARSGNQARSGYELTPLGQGGGSGLFENVAAVEMALVVEVVVDRGSGQDGLAPGSPRGVFS